MILRARWNPHVHMVEHVVNVAEKMLRGMDVWCMDDKHPKAKDLKINGRKLNAARYPKSGIVGGDRADKRHRGKIECQETR